MIIRITRSFERTRQIADFIPVKAACEAAIEFDYDDLDSEARRTSDELMKTNSAWLDAFVQSEVEKTLAGYTPSCIVCGGKALFPKKVLNKEGVCAQCQSENEMKLRDLRKGRSTE